MIIYGHRLYGRTCEVPEIFFVATEFFHLYFIPLIPFQSWLVFSEQGRGLRKTWTGIKVRMSWGSVFQAWSIGVGTGFGVWLTLNAVLTGGNTYWGHSPVVQGTTGIVTVVAALFAKRLPWVRLASPREALRLCANVEVPDSIRNAVKQRFGVRSDSAQAG